MSELIEKLGIDWKLLLAQAVNFLLILVILRLTVYKPLLNILKRRREKIEQGMQSAELAKQRLEEIEGVKAQKIAEGEKESMKIIEKAESAAREREASLLALAHTKERDILVAAQKSAQQKQKEAEEAVYKEAVQLVRQSVEKIVGKHPAPFDEALVGQVIEEIKRTKI